MVKGETTDIFRSALPYYGRRVDLCRLDRRETEFAQRWVRQLLRRELSLQIDTADEFSAAVSDLYFSAKNTERQRGPKTLGVGYPIVLTDSPEGELMAAPLFVFRLEMEASPTRINAWVAKHHTGLSIEANRELLRYFKDEFSLNLQPAVEALLGDFSREALEDFCGNLAEATEYQNRLVYHSIEPFPSFDEIGALSLAGTIQPSAVLGLFPGQSRETSSENQLEASEVFAPAQHLLDAEQHPFSPISLTPEQSSAYEGALRQRSFVIDGSEGTGKTRIVNALLLNALSRGQKTLVVSPHVPALVKQQQRLVGAGVLRFHFLFKNMLADKAQFLELVRATASGSGLSTAYRAERWDASMACAQTAYDYLRRAYRAVHRPIFGNSDWTEVVGCFLRAQRIEDRSVLEQLPVNEFHFTEEEFGELGKVVRNSRPLFRKIGTLKHPLTELHPRLFLEADADESRAELEASLTDYQLDIDRLQERLIRRADAYAEKLDIHYRRYAALLHDQVRELREDFARAKLEYGDRFVRAGETSLRLLGNLSERRRNLREARHELTERYRLLLRTHADRPYFDFTPQTPPDPQKLGNLTTELDRFDAALRAWESKLVETVRAETLALDEQTARPHLDFDHSTRDLAARSRTLVERLNETSIYRAAVPVPVGKQLHLVERLDELSIRLQRTRERLGDFADFHAWERYYLGAKNQERKLIDALIQRAPEDWIASFESWYLDRVLQRNFTAHLPTTDEHLEKFVAAHGELSGQFLDRIMHLNQEQEQRARRAFRAQNRAHHDLIFNSSTRTVTTDEGFRELAASGLDALTATLPVLFTTPDIARRILPHRPGYFDRVVFLGAEHTKADEVTQIGALGKQVVLSGDATAEEVFSLTEIARTLAVPTVHLRETHRTPLSGLELFERLRRRETTGGKREKVAVYNAAGRFAEREGTNDVEAQYVIQLINGVDRTVQRTFPRVGIVCFTPEQRNLIAAYLLRIRQRMEPGAQKIEQLQRNGLGVFHIDEIDGRDFDQMIVSTTFGVADHYGAMTKRVKQLDRETSRLHQLLHKSPQTTQIVHSLPNDVLENYLEHSEERGTHLLAAYLKYQEARSEQREETAYEYLRHFTEPAAGKPTVSTFSREVIQRMSHYLPRYRMQTNVPTEDTLVPILLRADYPGEPDWVICPEGFLARTPETDFLWEYHRRRALASANCSVHPAYSVYWWREPQRAGKKLAAKALREDSRFGMGMV